MCSKAAPRRCARCSACDSVRRQLVGFHRPGGRPLLPPRKGGTGEVGQPAPACQPTACQLAQDSRNVPLVKLEKVSQGPWSGMVRVCCRMSKASEGNPTCLLPASPQCPPWETGALVMTTIPLPPCPQRALAQKRPAECAEPKPQNSRTWKGFSTAGEPWGPKTDNLVLPISSQGGLLVTSGPRLMGNCVNSNCSFQHNQGCLALGGGEWRVE